MRIRLLPTAAALAAFLAAAGLSSPTSADQVKNGAASATTSGLTKAASAMPKVKGIPHLVLPAPLGVPGERKAIVVSVEHPGTMHAPLAGVQVFLKVSGARGVMLPVRSDASGKATFLFTIPDGFVEQAYAMSASSEETADYAPAHADGKLWVTKASTEVRLSDLVWGSYKNEGPSFGSYFAEVVRKHDGKILDLPIVITVNGTYYNTVKNAPNQLMFPPVPSPWTVEANFQGNGSYAGFTATKTYVKPQ